MARTKGHHRTEAKEQKARYQPSKDSIRPPDVERERLKNQARQNREMLKILNDPSKPNRKFRLVRVEDNPDKDKYINGPLKKPFQLKDHPLWVLLDKRDYKVVAVVRQTPYSSMTKKKLSELKFISTYLRNERNHGNAVKNNHAMLRGYMGAVGYRKSCDAGEVAGGYRPCKKVQTSRKALNRWWRLCVSRRPKIERIYARYFKSLSKSLFEETRAHLKDLNVPSFSQESHMKNPHVKYGFAGNFTYTMDAFTNTPHLDNDSSNWSYGIFFSIHNKTGDLALKGCDIKGGQFWWPDLNCEVDFSTCIGITEILWRGKQDLHCTRECEEPSGDYTRFGTSVQINVKYERMAGPLSKRFSRKANPVPLPWQLKRYKMLGIPCPKYIGSPKFLRQMYLKKIKAEEKVDSLKKRSRT